MSDFFEKIATLVNAQLHDLLGRNPRSPLARIKLDAEQSEKDPQGSARSLRRRLEEAIDYEDELQARIDDRMREFVELDKLVDEMLRSGDKSSAQRLQGQLNMKQQQLTIAESELRDHRLLTRHLMQELSTLEMALDNQQRRAANESRQRASRGGGTRIPIDGAASAGGAGGRDSKSFMNSVSDKFEETRANLESLLGDAPASEPPKRSRPIRRFEIIDEEPDPRRPKPSKKEASDMNDRLSRLSKPSDDV